MYLYLYLCLYIYIYTYISTYIYSYIICIIYLLLGLFLWRTRTLSFPSSWAWISTSLMLNDIKLNICRSDEILLQTWSSTQLQRVHFVWDIFSSIT